MAKDKKLLTRQELAKLTHEARGTRSQKEVAEHFGVSQAAISKAENDTDASLDQLRMKIIRAYTNYDVEGPNPYFEVADRT